MGGEGNNHSSQPSKLHSIDFLNGGSQFVRGLHPLGEIATRVISENQGIAIIT